MADARYLVSARKYRPQTFADLVSQEHVTGTLQNAIRLDRLAHAYLFSGPRGVGKTTAARLLAKAINCQTPLDARDGAEPCRTCDACRAFEEGRSMNVIEMDAASNNKVEDVRTLRENVLIPPQGARRKVYIVDEVHMLSTAAFNAFLKTLEEPPEHAIFIFATTEPHKVLPTILSRCQRFDFRRITVEQTVERLREIAAAEKIKADDAALHLVAQKGDGALRDALSTFDQAVALCGADLRYTDLIEALGVVDRDLFFETMAHVEASDTAALLNLVDRVVRRGYDLAEFVSGLVEHLRHLYVAASTGATTLIEADQSMRARYAEAASGRSEADLLRAMMVTDELEREMKQSTSPRLKVELGLLKLAHLERTADLTELMARIEALASGQPLEPKTPAPKPTASTSNSSTPTASQAAAPRAETTQTSALQPASPSRPAPRSAATAEPANPYGERQPEAPRPEAPRPEESRPEPSRSEPPHAAAPTEPVRPEPSRPEPAARPAAPRASFDGPPPHDDADHHGDVEPDDPEAFRPSPPRPPSPAPEPPRAQPARPSAPPAVPPSVDELEQSLFGAPALKRPRGGSSASHGDGSTQAFAAPPQLSEAPGSAGDPHFGLPLGRVRELWPRLVERVRAERPSVATVLARAEPTGAARGTIEVAVPDDFTRSLLHDERDAFDRALRDLLGGDAPPLAFVVRAEAAETAADTDPFEALKRLRQEHPVLRFLFERFHTELDWA